jgi:hypothetical protein
MISSSVYVIRTLTFDEYTIDNILIVLTIQQVLAVITGTVNRRN